MLIALILVLVLAAVCGVFGLLVHGLLWLFWIALIVFVITLAVGFARRTFTTRTAPRG